MTKRSHSMTGICLCIPTAFWLAQPALPAIEGKIFPGTAASILAAASKEGSRPRGLIKKHNDSCEYLRAYRGKYPKEVSLFKHAAFEARLRKLLGGQYDYLYSIWDVETPIEITNGLFYAWGMQAHSGGDPSAVIMADLGKNVLYAGIRRDGKVTLYSEDGGPVPQRLLDWSRE